MTDSDSVADLELSLYSQARLLAPVRALVGSFARRLGFGEAESGQLSLALDEALCNIINHGYERQPDGRIRVCLFDLKGGSPGVRIVVEDRAKQVDPSTIRSRDLDDIRPGGLGVYIIREIMDEVSYECRDDTGMRLVMTKWAQAVDEPAVPPCEGSRKT